MVGLPTGRKSWIYPVFLLCFLGLVQLSTSQGGNVEIVAISNDTLVYDGDTAILVCVGYGLSNVAVSWTRGGQAISTSSLVSISEQTIVQGGRMLRMSLLQLCSLQASDSGEYTCSVTSGLSVISSTVELSVDGGSLELVGISNDTSVLSGETAVLTCVGYGLPNVGITWSRGGQVISNSSLVPIYEETFYQEGRLLRQSFLQLCSSQTSDSGVYTCSLSNGISSVDSTVDVSVISGALELAAISNDTSVDPGDTAVLICGGYGVPNIDITWSRNDQDISNSSLVPIYEEDFVQGGQMFRQSFLQLCSIQTADTGVYTCSVSNGISSTDSSVNVYFIALELAAISYDTVVYVGNTVVLICAGYSLPTVNITWSRDDQIITNSSLVTIYEQDVVQGGRVVRQSLLQLCSLQTSDSGVYTCSISNGISKINSDVDLSVDLGALELAAVSNDTIVDIGDTVVLTCGGYGLPYLDITWSRGSQVISNSTLVTIYEENVPQGGRVFRQSYLQLCSLQSSDLGVYTCSISNGIASVITDVNVYFPVLELTAISYDTTLFAGGTAILYCTGYSMPNMDITWSRGGQVISNTSLVTIIYEQNLVQGDRLFRQSFLQLCSLQISDSGEFTCSVDNGMSSVNSTVYLTVDGGVREVSAISNDTTVIVGGTTVLSCLGYGLPNVDITWSRGGQIISNSSLVTIYEEDLTFDGRVFTQSFLQLCSLQTSDSGVYTCSVYNGISSVNSTVDLFVDGGVLELEAISNDTPVNAGETVILTCVGYGLPYVDITWSRGGQVVSNSSTVTIYEQDFMQGGRVFRHSLLQVCDVQRSSAGDYNCSITNGISTQSVIVQLILEDLELTAISNDTTVYTGESAVLICVGSGYPVDVTWSSGGQAISNSSLVSIYEEDLMIGDRVFRQSFLQLCSLQTSGSTNYTCAVGNNIGSMTSDVQLSVDGGVLELAAISNDTTVYPGDNAVLICVGYGLPNVDITWSRGGQVISNSSLVSIYEEDLVQGDRVLRQSLLQLCSLQTSDSGGYTCSISNGISSINSTVDFLVDGGVLELAIISNDTTVEIGETAVLVCLGFGLPNVDITWSRGGQVVSNSSLVTIYEEDFIQGGRVFRQSVLQLCDMHRYSAGAYNCSITNGISTQSAIVQLILEEVELTAISYDTLVYDGGTAILTCVGSSVPFVDITWSSGGQVVANSSLVNIYEEDLTQGGRPFKQSFLQLCSLQTSDSANYTCVVGNGLVTASSDVQLSVSGGVLEVLGISYDTTVIVGGTTVLVCVGFGLPYVDITWTRGGQVIPTNSLVSIYERDFTYGGRALKQSLLQLCGVQMSASGEYSCSLGNGISSLNSSVDLRVDGGVIEITAISGDTTVIVGETAVLVCVGYGQPNMDITWSRGGQVISNSSLVTIYEEDLAYGGRVFRQSFLQLCNIQAADVGGYTCSVNNSISLLNSTVNLIVDDGVLELEAISNGTSVEIGDTAVLTCVGYGLPSVDITWSRGGQVFSNSSLVIIYEQDLNYGGRVFRQSQLQLCDLQTSDSGVYTCSIRNEISSSNFTVDLLFTGGVLELTGVSYDATVIAGGSAILYCVGYGLPTVDITWSRGGQVISNSSLVIIYEEDLVYGGRVLRQSFLQLCSVQTSDSGVFTCSVSNGISLINSDVALSVDGGVLEITAISNDTTVFIGEAVVLTCLGYGIPNVDITWSRGGQVISSSTLVSIYEENLSQGGRVFKQSLLQLCSIQTSDAGAYTCSASNGISSINSTVALSVDGGTVEVAAISNDTFVYAGGTAILFCAGFGLPNAAITWSSGGQVISSSSLVSIYEEDLYQGGRVFRQSWLQLCDVQVPDSGRYTCTVSNEINTISSSVYLTSRLEIESCQNETQEVIIDGQSYGNVTWPTANIGDEVQVSCPCDLVKIDKKASRMCGGDLINGPVWQTADYSACQLSELTQQVCRSKNVVELGTVLKSSSQNVGVQELTLACSTVSSNAPSSVGNATASDNLLDLIDSALQAPITSLQEAQEMGQVSSCLLEAFDMIIRSYPITQSPQVVSKTSFACLRYGIFSSRNYNFEPGIQNNQVVLLESDTPVATFTLPASAITQAATTPDSVTFCMHISDGFFVRRNSYLQQTNRVNFKTGGYVISATLGQNISVSNLREHVTMSFVRKQDVFGPAECSYWNKSLDEGYGAWSTEGCFLVKDGQDSTSCTCSHLTDFAIVVDTTNAIQQDQQIGAAIIIGPIVLLICVVFVFICIVITRGLRSSTTGLFLANLCVAIAVLCVSFIIANFAGSNVSFCAVMAFLVHYFVLVVCAALPTMTFFLGFSPLSGKKLTFSYIASIIIDWVVPAVIVIVCIAANTDSYRPVQSDLFCRPVSGPYWFGLLMLGALLILVTLILLIVIFFRHRSDSVLVHKPSNNNWYLDYFGLLLVAICFFVAFGFGLPATRPLNVGVLRILFQIIFIVFCILCGVFMIVFFCLLSKDVQEALCCCCNHVRHSDVRENPYYSENLTEHDHNAMALESKSELLFEDEAVVNDTGLPPYAEAMFALPASSAADEMETDLKEDLAEEEPGLATI